jgi:hypothetical protein
MLRYRPWPSSHPPLNRGNRLFADHLALNAAGRFFSGLFWPHACATALPTGTLFVPLPKCNMEKSRYQHSTIMRLQQEKGPIVVQARAGLHCIAAQREGKTRGQPMADRPRHAHTRACKEAAPWCPPPKNRSVASDAFGHCCSQDQRAMPWQPQRPAAAHPKEQQNPPLPTASCPTTTTCSNSKYR